MRDDIMETIDARSLDTTVGGGRTLRTVAVLGGAALDVVASTVLCKNLTCAAGVGLALGAVTGTVVGLDKATNP
jgi:hypothetical protein